uniref:Uncharacterized protein n=1 Tax=Pseudo-nitzschia australis TaxID=44445 RepID=A0A7S4EHP1_9STRA
MIRRSVWRTDSDSDDPSVVDLPGYGVGPVVSSSSSFRNTRSRNSNSSKSLNRIININRNSNGNRNSNTNVNVNVNGTTKIMTSTTTGRIGRSPKVVLAIPNSQRGPRQQLRQQQTQQQLRTKTKNAIPITNSKKKRAVVNDNNDINSKGLTSSLGNLCLSGKRGASNCTTRLSVRVPATTQSKRRVKSPSTATSRKTTATPATIKKTLVDTNATTYVHKNLVAWTEQVFAKVGSEKKEVCYQTELKHLLLQKGLDVGVEVPLKVQRLVATTTTTAKAEPPPISMRMQTGMENTAGVPSTRTLSQPAMVPTTISRRADLIVSFPGRMERVLIECKAKPKFTKRDFRQVMFYQHHFGISDCYLVNFCGGVKCKDDVQIHKLLKE